MSPSHPRRAASKLALVLPFLLAPASTKAELTNRWSFNEPAGPAADATVMADSVSSAPATVEGNGSTFTGAALTLAGSTNGNQSADTISGYVDLPNGIISSKTNLSLEFWATPLSVKTWQRLFDFGRVDTAGSGGGAPGEIIDVPGVPPGNVVASDGIYLSLCVNNDLNAQRFKARLNGVGAGEQDSAAATTPGIRYHYVVTFQDGVGTYGSNGGRMIWYRNGILIRSVDVNLHLSQIEDVNNWLGRSMFTTDSNANISYDEFRIYDHVLSPGEIAANQTAGPDTLVDPPDPVDPPVPDHLWTFTTQAQSETPSGTTFTDSIGSEVATLRGTGGSLDGGAVILPGSTNGNQPASTISAYLDLPNGLVSQTASVSFEAWASPLSSKNWQRLFDFGRCVNSHGAGAAAGEILDDSAAPGATAAYDNLSLTFNNAGNLNSQQLEGQYDGTPAQFSFSTATTTPGTTYHYVLVVEDGVGAFGASGCQARWYRDGALQNSMDFQFHLADMEDVNNWIGRSMYSGDSNAHLSLDELRIYRRAITPGEILTSYTEGPDLSVGPPEPLPPAPVPTRRWSFDTAPGAAPEGTTFLDAATGEIATIHGNDASLDGTRLILPGTTNGNQTDANIAAYLDLPNGILSARPDFTIEAWITPLSSKNWQRVFDFGNASLTSGPGAEPGEIIDSGTAPGTFVANDNLFLSLNNGGTLGSHRLAAKIGGGGETGTNTDLSATTSTGTEYHFVMTVEDGAGASGPSGCFVKFYRDGTFYGSADLAYRLPDLADVNNWIGRSNWAADSNSNVALNELRIHDRAISPLEVAASLAGGPAASFLPPVALNDAATLHPGEKVLVDVLANDSGGPQASTVEILTPPAIGTVTVQPSGKILYVHDNSGTDPVSFTYRVSGIGGSSDPATVDLSFATALRIPGTAFNVPLDPPPTAIAVVDAFPGVTFNRPLCLAPFPGDSRRLLVCEIGGLLKVIPDVTSATPTSATVLDLPAAIAGRTPAESIQGGANQECGLLGVAVHPDYDSNGHIFVSYTVVKAGTSGYFQRLSRFTVPPAEIDQPDPAADPGSELILIDQYDQGANHQGGDIHFGSDGFLYVAYGDEENGNDFRLNSQRIDKDIFSAMLRIDVDKASGIQPNPHPAIPTDANGARFTIPADNPFLGATEFLGQPVNPSQVRTEFFAVGLRSPWRFSIDPLTDEIWLGDVGQDRYEEIDTIEIGKNYGWVFREGAHDITASNGGWPAKPANFDTLATDPVYDYVHTGMAGDPLYKGNSVIGGVVYNGSRVPSLTGSYIFGDQVSGHLWSLVRNGANPPTVTRIAGLPTVSSFGIDPSNGDVLMTYTPAGAAVNNGYTLKRLVSTTLAGSFPATLSETGLFADLADLSPQPGLLPYQPNITFWSDHALKRRWFSIPDDAAKMTWNRDGAWDYPEGQIFVKHFDLELERGNPATAKRLETRLLIRNDVGAFGVSYRWNDAGTEATLVADGGDSFPVDITVDGFPYTQTWQIPSRSQCNACHTETAGHALSFNTRQLNRPGLINGFSGNQIELLHAAGYLSNTPDADLPAHPELTDLSQPLEARVRAYFDVNCAYCHQPGGGGPGWDGRAPLTLEETGIIHGPVAATLHPGDELIVPGDPLRSVILSRIASANGYTRMPPLATSELDQDAIAMITEWIGTELPAHPLYGQWRDTYFAAADPNGAKGIDADGDGLDNYTEYLLGSSPLDPTGAWQATLGQDGGTLSFMKKAYRRYLIETSDDLGLWEKWDVPENDDQYSTSDTPVTLPTPAGDRRFFRFRVNEP